MPPHGTQVKDDCHSKCSSGPGFPLSRTRSRNLKPPRGLHNCTQSARDPQIVCTGRLQATACCSRTAQAPPYGFSVRRRATSTACRAGVNLGRLSRRSGAHITYCRKESAPSNLGFNVLAFRSGIMHNVTNLTQT